MKTDRLDVYVAIDSERDYQDSRWGNTLSGDRVAPEGQGGHRTLDEFCVYIIGYSNDLLVNCSHFSNSSDKLDIIRKIAGLCVATMEQHGAPMRKIK